MVCVMRPHVSHISRHNLSLRVVNCSKFGNHLSTPLPSSGRLTLAQKPNSTLSQGGYRDRGFKPCERTQRCGAQECMGTRRLVWRWALGRGHLFICPGFMQSPFRVLFFFFPPCPFFPRGSDRPIKQISRSSAFSFFLRLWLGRLFEYRLFCFTMNCKRVNFKTSFESRCLKCATYQIVNTHIFLRNKANGLDSYGIVKVFWHWAKNWFSSRWRLWRYVEEVWR